jgi:hypothetical protein
VRSVGLVVFALVLLALLVFLLFAIFGQRPTGTAVASPTPTATVTPAATLTITSTPAATQAPSPPPSPAPTAVYANSTYKFSVTLPAPYRKSLRAVIGDPTPQRYRDAFTARTDADEASIDTSGCHTTCPLWQYVAYVIVNTGTGSQTPRQYYAAQGGSASQVIEDTLVDGRTAISVTSGVPFPMQFIIKDGDRIVVVAYQLYPPENGMAVPAGATKEKLDSILASFKFTP